MRAGGVFHPDYFYHIRPSVNSTQIARAKVYAPTGERANWTPGVGIPVNTTKVLVWEGYARFQPNRDWRARPRNHAGEHVSTHAIRVQLPIGQNEFGAVLDADDNIISYGEDPIFESGFWVEAVDVPVTGSDALENLQNLVVRNALRSSNSWLYNLLCDVGTAE